LVGRNSTISETCAQNLFPIFLAHSKKITFVNAWRIQCFRRLTGPVFAPLDGIFAGTTMLRRKKKVETLPATSQK